MHGEDKVVACEGGQILDHRIPYGDYDVPRLVRFVLWPIVVVGAFACAGLVFIAMVASAACLGNWLDAFAMAFESV